MVPCGGLDWQMDALLDCGELDEHAAPRKTAASMPQQWSLEQYTLPWYTALMIMRSLQWRTKHSDQYEYHCFWEFEILAVDAIVAVEADENVP
jgi:hypothetical protein